jgi:similar to stage IV sporulation protein
MIVRPDLFLLGYRIFTVTPEDIAKAATLFLKNKMSIKFIGNKFAVREGYSKRVEKILSGNVEYSKSEILGFGGFLFNHRKRWGIIAALAIVILMFVFSSNRVWDVRIIGCETGNEENILKELEKCGLSGGVSWSAKSKSKIEVEMLASSEYVSWLNINRRGTVAYVTVVDKAVHDEPEQKEGYANIVASCDAVIEEITVMKGIAAVKAGDSVKKGDLLISGIIPDELGGGVCYAEGTVIGRCSNSVYVSISNFIEEKVEEKRSFAGMKVKFFNFSVNIFNFYRNCGSECDIIEKTKQKSLFGKNLPLVVTKKYCIESTILKKELTAEQMAKLAREQMQKELEHLLSDATLLKIRTAGGFDNSVYTMSSDVIFTQEIGIEVPFGVE